MKMLITGGAGFIGSHFTRMMLQRYPEDEIVVLDKLTYAGRMENLLDIREKIRFIRGDIGKLSDVRKVRDVDVIFNFAAETHVDRSIESGGVFVRTDVLGTYTLLEYARATDVGTYVQISTDEVYGSIPAGSSRETDILAPSSPYSASKAGAEMLVGAFHATYGVPARITRSSNNFGPNQYPEKLIPVLILKALQDQKLPIYGKGNNIRDWIYVLDNCDGIDHVFRNGKAGEVYNIGGGNERTNLEIAHAILAGLGKPAGLLTFVTDRPGHDFRYALDCTKMRESGWAPKYAFSDALGATIRWYRDNAWWWEPLLTPAA
jgi:dTDP-glucose 4,6-dehydratase